MMMAAAEGKGMVCVTGGTGFLASWLIKKLLHHGYTVRTTLRSYPPASKRDISYLTNLPGASENLQIFSADLSHPESFEPVIQGCIGVFHLAHPIDFEDKETEEVKTKRSIDATLAIMKACLSSTTVKKFVYTSSAFAVAFNGKEDVSDENDWSDIDYVRSLNIFGTSYMISKILTEKAVIEFSQTHGLDYVSIIPTYVHGPFICPYLPSSVYTSMAMILGIEDHYTQLVKQSMVHVDDVCSAHIYLFEKPGTKGRYICSAVDVTIEKLSDLLSSRYPEYFIPTPESLKDVKRFKYPYLSSKKLLDSGFKYKYSLEEMYDEAIQLCKEKGIL